MNQPPPPTKTSAPPQQSSTVLMQVLDQIETCIRANPRICTPKDMEDLKYKFTTNMSMAMGGAYADNYSAGLSALFDVMVSTTPPSMMTIVASIGNLFMTFLFTTVMSFVGRIPGIGEIDPLYTAFKQITRLYPILGKLKSIMSVNMVSLFMNKDYYAKIHEYIKCTLDIMVDINRISPQVANLILIASGKIKNILEKLYYDTKEYMKQTIDKQQHKESVRTIKGTLKKLYDKATNIQVKEGLKKAFSDLASIPSSIKSSIQSKLSTNTPAPIEVESTVINPMAPKIGGKSRRIFRKKRKGINRYYSHKRKYHFSRKYR